MENQMVHLKSSEFMAKVILPIKQMLALMLFLHYIVHCIGSIVKESDFFFQGKGFVSCELRFCMVCQVYFQYLQRTWEMSLMAMGNICSVCIDSF